MRFADVIVQKDIPCMMRDGVTLYADIYAPEEHGEFPVLLMRQPYGKKIASTVTMAHPVWYAKQGYMVVIQDVRGRGISEGDFNPFINEVEDGYDTLEWAAQLPHSNGKIGMYGFSYQGWTQWAAVASHSPHLVAIAPGMCATDLYSGKFYPHGRFDIQNIAWAFQLARDTARRAGDREAEAYCTRVMSQPKEWMEHMPIIEEHPILAKYFPHYYEWVAHPEYDEYWEKRNLLPSIAGHDVPAFHIGGWYDFFMMGTLRSYDALKESSTPQKLLMGPWTHIPWGRKAGMIDHGVHSLGNIHSKQLEWFDYWLKGKGDMNGNKPVEYFEIGSMQWRSSEKLPLTTKEIETYRLYVSGGQEPANGSLGGGRLVEQQEEVESHIPDIFVYDARLPMSCDSYLPKDRSAIQDRFEILVYSGKPNERSFSILGSPSIHLFVQVMNGPTDLVAILTVVKADGSARFLSIGRVEVSEKQEWEQVTIPMRPVAAQLEAGDAIRLELTGSAFPIFVRHPNGVETKDIHRVGPESLQIATVAIQSVESTLSFIDFPIHKEEESNFA